MSDQKNGGNDAYAELLNSFSRTASERKAEKKEKDSGISFSQPASPAPEKAFRTSTSSVAASGKKTADGEKDGKKDGAKKKAVSVRKPRTTDENGEEPVKKKKKMTKKQKRRKKRLKAFLRSLLSVFIIVVFVALASLIIKTPIMGCVNDILAIDRDNIQKRVVVEDGMTVDGILDLLAEKDLIYSSTFCKIVTKFLKYDKDAQYAAGTYDLSADMGMELMLLEIMAAGEKQDTVTITFPEGFTVDQIIEKLVENGVADKDALYEKLADEELLSKYDFLNAIENGGDRVYKVEGYLLPDTYDFFVGEDPESVITKFLNNFDNKWTEFYDEKAEALDMTTDEIIILASILEKEGNGADQMATIASILYNRMNSGAFPYLNCDSTGDYIETFADRLDEETYAQKAALYDTYEKTGFPVGAICNPGIASIEAALEPADTDYFYFLHDAEGNMHVARTADEHAANQQYLP